MELPGDYEDQIKSYGEWYDATPTRVLGTGTQGTVLTAQSPRHPWTFAVKFHRREIAYNREVGVYLRLQDLEVTDVCGHDVPLLLTYDDELLTIEMTIVSSPFCLDFGWEYLDKLPDYSPEVWRDWREEKEEDFDGKCPAVEEILDEFRWMGIHNADVNPGNIRF